MTWPLDARVARLGVSPTLAARERATSLAIEGRRVYQLGLGQSPFPVPQIVVEALRAHAAEKEYLPVRGLEPLRAAVADYHRRRHGVARGVDDVVVGPGSKELMFLLHLCFDGDILVPTPAWVSYGPQARIAGRRTRTLPMSAGHGFRLSPDLLEQACSERSGSARLLILNYPSNPAGSTYSEAELVALAKICRRNDVIVMSDEIYGELTFEGTHVSLARVYEEGTILSSGLSKWCGAGGWRLGTLCFPPGLRWLANAVAAVGSETYSTTSAPIQFAAVTAFRGGPEIEEYLVQARRILRTLLPWAATRLRGAGLSVPTPAGGFYLLPSFAPRRAHLASRGIHTDRDLAEKLLSELGVSCLPASVFGHDPEALALRLALVDFDGARALAAAIAGAPLDEQFLRAYATPVHDAILRLQGWAGSS